MSSAVLGFPRIGANREVKKATEAYWQGKHSVDQLQAIAKDIRLGRLQTIKDAGVEVIPRSASLPLYLSTHVETDSVCAQR